MKLILLEGSPAYGKSTLGEKLVEIFGTQGEKSVLVDHDVYIDDLFPAWIQFSQQRKEKEITKAKNKHLSDINKYLVEGFVVLAIGGIWLTDDDVNKYTSKLAVKSPVFLFHLNAPLEIRKQREEQRGHNPIIALDQVQKERDMISSWPGYVFQNISTPEIDAARLMKLIQDGEGTMRY